MYKFFHTAWNTALLLYAIGAQMVVVPTMYLAARNFAEIGLSETTRQGLLGLIGALFAAMYPLALKEGTKWVAGDKKRR